MEEEQQNCGLIEVGQYQQSTKEVQNLFSYKGRSNPM